MTKNDIDEKYQARLAATRHRHSAARDAAMVRYWQSARSADDTQCNNAGAKRAAWAAADLDYRASVWQIKADWGAELAQLAAEESEPKAVRSYTSYCTRGLVSDDSTMTVPVEIEVCDATGKARVMYDGEPDDLYQSLADACQAHCLLETEVVATFSHTRTVDDDGHVIFRASEPGGSE